MKISSGAIALTLAAVLAAGCASRKNTPAYKAGDEVPPDFLTGPEAVVLTNLNGFSAHVTWTTTTADGLSKNKSGDLLGRDGVLLYQPTLAIKGKRARTEGGLFFLWDETRHGGYVMSEALQGYAPLPANSTTASGFAIANEGIREDVDGHPCHRCQAIITLDNGEKMRLTLWQADDQSHFPLRIESLGGMNRVTLNFSDVRVQYPNHNLFLPPDGFTAYPTSAALMNELIVRDSTLSKKPPPGGFDEPTERPPANLADIRRHQPRRNSLIGRHLDGAPGTARQEIIRVSIILFAKCGQADDALSA